MAPPPLPGTTSTATPKSPELQPIALTPAPSSANDPRRDVNLLLASAKELRTLGNTQDALQVLQQADLVAPNHAAVMAETAEVYEQMGLSSKAVDLWRGIQLQGPAKAGAFHDLAMRRLSSLTSTESTAVADVIGTPPPMESERRLRLGACQIVRDFSVQGGGERYLLRVPIQRGGSKSIDINAIDLKTFFYYRQGSQTVLDHTHEPAEVWQTQPVDWVGSDVEIVDVIYTLPAPTAAEQQQRTQKTYHGYMLHLYYDNKLQDVAAEPRDLLEAAGPVSQPLGNSPNPLLPPVGR
jgi:hypothetical protein